MTRIALPSTVATHTQATSHESLCINVCHGWWAPMLPTGGRRLSTSGITAVSTSAWKTEHPTTTVGRSQVNVAIRRRRVSTSPAAVTDRLV